MSSVGSSRSSSPRPRPPTSRRREPWRTSCAPTSRTVTAGFPARSSGSWGTGARSRSSSPSCSTRPSGTPPSGASASCWAPTSTGTPRGWRCSWIPTRLGSPLHQFRQEINEGFKGVHERLTAIEAASRARADERSRSAAKGGDFEDLLEGMLGELARGAGDLLDRTGTEAGALVGSKKGDFVLTLDPRLTRGADVRVVIEAKDRVMSPRAMREELREARENRGASVAIAAWSAKHAPKRRGALHRQRRGRPRRGGPGRPGPGVPGGRGAARPPPRPRQARRARCRGGCPGHRSGAGRGQGAARGHPGAQDPADLGRQRDQVRRGRPGRDARGILARVGEAEAELRVVKDAA